MTNNSGDPTVPTGQGSREPTHPERIGPYRILQVLGEGGMGVVYDAEQLEPVKRRVALKVVKLGMDTKEVVARFDAERQALAVMDHPNIAKVYHAGATDTGRPYFVMEKVQGIPITQFCDEHKLTTGARLKLFMLVCEAVQHAHQKGVIHRDLKPSNVLVTFQDGIAVTKIIDFGIAKAINWRLSEKTLVTELGQPIGTPAYMSPEQWEASGLDVDTRSDVYSLGVMLYELLVGRLPVEPETLTRAGNAAAWLLQESAPPTPSNRLAGLGEHREVIAHLRGTDSTRLRRELQGDLDWIVMKAMEPDRTRRYETANGLALEIHRHLHHEPVLARPPSITYRFRKFAQRHTAGVAIGAVVGVLVVAFAATMTIQARVIARERDRAELEAAKAHAVRGFMEQTLLAPDPLEGLGRDVTVVEALAQAVEEIDSAFAGRPELDAAARSAIGWAYFQMGRYDEAGPLLQRALAIRRETVASPHADLAESIHQWARLHRVRAQYDSAEVLYRDALQMRRAALGSEHPDIVTSLRDLSTLYVEQGRYEEAETLLEEALSVEARTSEESLAYADLQNQVGVILWEQGKYDELEPLWRSLLEKRQRLLGEEHPLVAESMNNLGVLFDNTGRTGEAEQYYRDALGIMQRTLGPEHEEVGAAMGNLAILLDTKGDYDEAEQLYRNALRIDRKQLGDDNPAVAGDLVNLAALLCEIDRAEEGVPLLDEALTIFVASLEPRHWRVGNTHQWKGRCLANLGRYRAAEREYLVGLAIMTDAFGATHMRVERVRDRMADMYEAWGKPNKAAEYRSVTNE